MAQTRPPPPPQAKGRQGAPQREPPSRVEQVRSLVRQTMPRHLAPLLPKGVTADRWTKVFLTLIESTVGSSSDLSKCSDGSLARALMHSAEVQLLPGGAYPHCYIIPYFNRDRDCDEAQFQISVWGFVELMRRSGEVKKVWADVVYSGDHFKCVSGTAGKIIEHEPQWFANRADRGQLLGAYACGLLANGETICEPVSGEDLELARKQNRGKSPAWDLWPDQQRQKVAIKRMAKYAPRSAFLDAAIDIDENPDRPPVIDVQGEELPADPRPAAASTTAPLDQVVAREAQRTAEQPQQSKLVIDREVLFSRLCDLDERWLKLRARVDGWEELDALGAMAYVQAISKDLPPDAEPPRKPECMRLDRIPGEDG